MLERLTGTKLPRTAPAREARRQGERGQALRRQLDAQATAAPKLERTQLELSLAPHRMILQIDAWNIRERDDWGATAALRRSDQEPACWRLWDAPRLRISV